jgi:hypothetical protein
MRPKATGGRIKDTSATIPRVKDTGTPAPRVETPKAESTPITPLAQLEKATLATGVGEPCKKCKKPLPCDIVRVEKGQTLSIRGMPFIVGIRADFEMCCRCGSFYFHRP